jgi:hypothetical protein
LRVRTDDEIYRIDAVWLGPPRATFPWRATYASYLTGFLIFIAVLFVQRRLGIAFNIFPTAWALVITVFLTRLISRKVNYEKGVVHLLEHFWHEVTGPRERTKRWRTVNRSNHVRVRRPEPMATTRRGVSQRTAAGRPSAHSVPGPVGGPFSPPSSGGTANPKPGAARRSRVTPVPYRSESDDRPTGPVKKQVPPLPDPPRPSRLPKLPMVPRHPKAARPSRRPVLRPTRPGDR